MKHIALVLGAIIALAVGGCTTGGLPRGAHVVGGGLKIHWTPPASDSGTAILVEQTTGKTVMTQTLDNLNPSFDFDVANPRDQQVLRSVFAGAMATNAQYVLYFVPGGE